MHKKQLEQNIKNMEAELAKMKEELARSEKIEIEYQPHRMVLPSVSTTQEASTQLGFNRATKELAEIASKNMIARNKLEAYAHQIQGNSDGSYGIYIIPSSGKYSYTENQLNFTGSVRMYLSTAQQICEWLNDGRISLEG